VLGRLVAAAPSGDGISPTPDGINGTDAAPDGTDAPHAGRGLRPFPDAATVAKLPDGAFPMPKTRIATIRALAEAVASDQVVLDGSVDRDETRAALEEIPGIGPWTANYVAMRALGDPDVFLGSDLGVLRAATAAGLPETPTRLIAHAKRWAPWRSYAVVRLWRM
jgi:AraC family transcriptional regulator of adaptative response / DNA-3-methyladenine glycosylase II